MDLYFSTLKENIFSGFKFVFLCFSIVICFSGCEDEPAIVDKTFTDAEGNVYPIGRMCDGKIWMLKNLATSNFRNGEPIPYVFQSEWTDLHNTSPAYCIFGDSMILAPIYGHLYNWYAVSDARKVAPAGWHVPTEAEWKALVDCNGGEDVAGAKLKEAGFAHWKSGTGTNESGFTALPGSRRLTVPNPDLGSVAVWWTALPNAECFSTKTPYYATHDLGIDAYSNCGLNVFGFSVRCVKD